MPFKKDIGGFNQLGGDAGFQIFGANGGASSNKPSSVNLFAVNNGLGSVLLTTGESINSVRLWLDFTNPDHYTFDGVNVTEVADISGYGLDATGTAGNGGTFQEDLIDGNSGLVIATGNGLQSGTTADFKFLSNGTPSIIYIIAKKTNESTDEYIYAWTTVGGLTNGMYVSVVDRNINYVTINTKGAGTLFDNLATSGEQVTNLNFHNLTLAFRGLDVPGHDKEIFLDQTSAASVNGLSAVIDPSDTAEPLNIALYTTSEFQMCEVALLSPDLEDLDSDIVKLNTYATLKYPSI